MTEKFRQAYWNEPLLKELSRPGRVGMLAPTDPQVRKKVGDPLSLVPVSMRRESVNLPELSELQVLR